MNKKFEIFWESIKYQKDWLQTYCCVFAFFILVIIISYFGFLHTNHLLITDYLI